MIGRRGFLAVGVGSLLASARAQAQMDTRVLRVGFLVGRLPSDGRPYLDAFLQSMREHGWIDGQNMLIEARYAGANPEQRYAALSAQLVRLNVSVLVTLGDQPVRALQRATSSIPIVTAAMGDPVKSGFAQSLARPGGNITGLSNLGDDLPGKWLQFIVELRPQTKRIGVLRNLASPNHDRYFQETRKAAQAVGLSVVSLGIHTGADLDRAFAKANDEQAEAVLLLPDPILGAQISRVASIAKSHRLPTLYNNRAYPDAGGLISYGANLVQSFRRVGTYVDKILRGAQPSELPIELTRDYELVVNLKTAKALDITVPESILLRADEVIR